jgi:hypothetical protein
MFIRNQWWLGDIDGDSPLYSYLFVHHFITAYWPVGPNIRLDNRDVAITRVVLHYLLPLDSRSNGVTTQPARSVNLVHFHKNNHPFRSQGIPTTALCLAWYRSCIRSSDGSRTLASRRSKIQSTIFYFLPHAYYIRPSLPDSPTGFNARTSYTNLDVS